MVFQAFPKVELHLHLDCSLSYDVVRRLDPAVTEEIYRRDFVGPAKCRDLAEFLTVAPREIALMQSEEALRLTVADLFEQLQRDHVIYAEIRFAPLLHMEKGLSAREVVEIVEAATTQARRISGVEARLLLCTLRHFSAEESMQTVRLVELFRGTSVTGFDIAGGEADFPLAPHVAAFEYAHAHGLFCTAHAGEACGAKSVWETLRTLGPSRIGHGVRSIEDADLVEYLKRERIHLEACPTSNVQTNICETYKDHPIDQLYQRGVALNVNTDTRTITNVTLTQEYERLHEYFGWDKEHFLRCNLQAIAAAFLAEDEKRKVEQRFRDAFAVL
jgi:adenosine deaminase